MYIIYNKDGSIKKKNFAEFIQKGNNNANFIFVGIDGLDLTDYSCYATFELPNGDLGGPVAGVPIVEFGDELPYSGYNIPVTAEMTQYEGQLKLSLHIENSQGAVMYTYPVILVINDATAAPDETKISLSQYQALLNAINSKPVPTSNLFFTVVDDISAIPETEMAQYSVGKIFYDKATQMFYQKTQYGISNYRLFIPDYLMVDLNETWATLKYSGLWKCYLIKIKNNIIHFEDVAESVRNGDYDNKHLTNSKLKTFDKEIDMATSYGDYYFVLRAGTGGGSVTYLIPEFVFADLCYYKQIILYDKDSYYPSRVYNYNHKLIRLDSLEDIVELTNDGSVDSGTLTNEQAQRIFTNDNILLKHSGYFFRKVRKDNPTTFICIKEQYEISSSSVIVTYIEKILVTGVYDAYNWSRSSIYSRVYEESKVNELLDAKQNALTFDTTPTADSDNPVTSDGIKNYVDTVVSGAVHFKGTVADLTALNAIQNPAQGDMYWVTSESSYYIWNGSTWSKTGGTVDLSNYVDRTSNQTIGGTKTFTSGIETSQVKSNSAGLTLKSNYDFSFVVGSSTVFHLSSSEGAKFTTNVIAGANATYDLGSSTLKWKDLYLSGKLSDGTNETTIENIVTKSENQTITGIKTIITSGPDSFNNYGGILRFGHDSNDICINANWREQASNQYLSIYIGGQAKLQVGNENTYFNTHLLPGGARNPQDLGANTYDFYRWRNLYLSGKIDVGSWTFAQGLNESDQPDGSFNIKDSNGNLVLKFLQQGVGEGTISYNRISPSADNSKDLGSYGNAWGNFRWKTVYTVNISDGTNTCTIAEIYNKVHETVKKYYRHKISFAIGGATEEFEYISSSNTSVSTTGTWNATNGFVQISTTSKVLMGMVHTGTYQPGVSAIGVCHLYHSNTEVRVYCRTLSNTIPLHTDGDTITITDTVEEI